MTIKPEWLRNAILYEIYPQSFLDTNCDGIGDIPGIISKLDYLADLGVNVIWLNPCYDSPFQDAGYDVRNHYQVAPRYGSNDDLCKLFDNANRLGIKVLLDLVPGHTSSENPWFIESCKHQKNAYTDWFIWTDSAWNWDVPGYRVISGKAERDASYIANFFYFQPALNYGFANPDPTKPWQQPVDAEGPKAVRSEIRNIMRYWLDKGASGFRVDMAGWLVKGDPGSRETIKFWQEIRAWLDENYPEACLISEWGNPALAIKAGFHADFCLPFGTPGYTALLRKSDGQGAGTDKYGASFFSNEGHGNIREFLDDYLHHYDIVKNDGIIVLPTGNHDITPRLSENRSEDELKVVMTFLLTMPGAPAIYYGDEIGMRSIEGLPSKEGGYNRTASRTPMQWDSSQNAGFSQANPTSLYLPIDADVNCPSVREHQLRPSSLLNHIKSLIILRNAHPAFDADSEFQVVLGQPFSLPFIYLRKSSTETALVSINPSKHEVSYDFLEYFDQVELLIGPPNSLVKTARGWQLSLPGTSASVHLLTNYRESHG